MEETVELLKLLGFKSVETIEAHGVSGADLLELDDEELRDELKLPPLQLRKLKNLKAAFKTFNSMQRRPGKGDVTYMELQVTQVLKVLLQALLVERDPYVETLVSASWLLNRIAVMMRKVATLNVSASP